MTNKLNLESFLSIQAILVIFGSLTACMNVEFI